MANRERLGPVEVDDEHPVNGPLARLIDGWCERRELGALAVLLPAYTSNNGLTDGWAGVKAALHTLRGSRRLPLDELHQIDELTVIVERMVYRFGSIQAPRSMSTSTSRANRSPSTLRLKVRLRL